MEIAMSDLLSTTLLETRFGIDIDHVLTEISTRRLHTEVLTAGIDFDIESQFQLDINSDGTHWQTGNK